MFKYLCCNYFCEVEVEEVAHLTVVQTRGTNITKTDTLTFDMNRSFSTGFRSRVGLLTCSFYTLDLPDTILRKIVCSNPGA